MSGFDLTQRSLPTGALDGQMGDPLGDIRVFEAWLNGRMGMTLQESHVYVDFTNGDDDLNDGLSAASPVLTWEKVLSILPEIIAHDSVIHCAGTSSEFGTVYVNKHIMAGATLYIAGDDDWTVVDDNGGAHFATAGGTTVASITEAGGGLGVDAYKGYFAQILDGAAADDVQMLQRNTATVLTPVKNFAISPGVGGALFDIVRPKTLLTSSVADAVLYLNCTGAGTVRMQQFTIAGSKCVVSGASHCKSRVFSHLSITSTAASPLQTFGSYVELSGDKHDVVDGSATFGTALATSHGGVGFFSARMLTVLSSPYVLIGSSTLATTLFCDSVIANVYHGTRFKGASSFKGCRQFSSTTPFADTAGYAATGFDGSAGIGVVITESSHLYFTDIDITDSTSHGGEVSKNSSLTMLGVVTGTGNAGAGVYAHDGAQVFITNGSTPTLTGTVGNFAISNPAVQENTWAAVDAGTDVAIAARMTLVREV